MRTETYEVTTGHVYHVYCALGGSVYKCRGEGDSQERVLVGEMDSLELVSYQASAGWERLEADVPDEGYVQFRDHNGEYVVEQSGTTPGHYYNVYAADDVRIMYRNTVLLELPGFGGTGGFQAPGMNVTIRRKAGTEVSVMECAAGNCLATVHYTYNVISDMQ